MQIATCMHAKGQARKIKKTSSNPTPRACATCAERPSWWSQATHAAVPRAAADPRGPGQARPVRGVPGTAARCVAWADGSFQKKPRTAATGGGAGRQIAGLSGRERRRPPGRVARGVVTSSAAWRASLPSGTARRPPHTCHSWNLVACSWGGWGRDVPDQQISNFYYVHSTERPTVEVDEAHGSNSAISPLGKTPH